MHKLEPHRAEFELLHLYLKNWDFVKLLNLPNGWHEVQSPFCIRLLWRVSQTSSTSRIRPACGIGKQQHRHQGWCYSANRMGPKGFKTFQLQISVLPDCPILAFDHSLLTWPVSSSRPGPTFLHTFLFLLVINLERVETSLS